LTESVIIHNASNAMLLLMYYLDPRRIILVKHLMDKAHILREIKRTAIDNGGVPLGWRRFVTETGIKEYDWLGKFWARWSDALREAGFIPNQLREAYNKAELLEKYARLAQELDRLPTNNDLRLKAKLDANFPSATVFERLGTKSELIQQLLEYCQSREVYEDIIGLCEGYVPRNRGASEGSRPQEEEIGFVYLIKSGKFYKIGKTNAIGRREYELAIQLPERAITIHVIQTDDPSGIEAYWHKRFGAKRKNGEWFELDAADVTAFKRRKFM
jgi:hypothetical protein